MHAGGETVDADKLQLAAKLAKLELPNSLTASMQAKNIPDTDLRTARPQTSVGRLSAAMRAPAPTIPWKAAVNKFEYPEMGTEAVKLEARERAAVRRQQAQVAVRSYVRRDLDMQHNAPASEAAQSSSKS